jgi:hypothetical protein
VLGVRERLSKQGSREGRYFEEGQQGDACSILGCCRYSISARVCGYADNLFGPRGVPYCLCPCRLDIDDAARMVLAGQAIDSHCARFISVAINDVKSLNILQRKIC